MLTLRPSAATARDFNNRIESLRQMARPQPSLVLEVQRAIVAEFANNFESESAGGSRWSALAESTIIDRLQGGYGAGPILHRSGDYESSWMDPGNPDHVSDVQALAGGWVLEEGSQHRLAGFHEEGTNRMPARSVSDIGSGGEERLRQAVDDFILRSLVNR